MELPVLRNSEPDYRGLLAGVLLSLALHALILNWWPIPFAEAPEPRQERGISLELRRYQDPGAIPGPGERSTAATESGDVRHTPNVDVATEVDQFRNLTESSAPTESNDSPGVSRLDLRLPGSDAPVYPSSSHSGAAERDRRVFDPRLAGQLAELRSRRSPRPRFERSNGPLSEVTRMTGSHWSTFVRVGKRCFEVIEADPLDELSRDQWYPVDCSK